MRFNIAALAASIALAGCASIGTNFDPATLTQLTPGMTEAEVVSRMGAPNSRTTMQDGSTSLMWLHSSANAFGSGAANSAAVLIDQDGKFVRVITTTETKLN